MNHPVTLHETYLYRINALSNALNKMFDQVLRTHTEVTLSQLMVLLTIAEHPGINQRRIAHYLEVSAVAVKRQTDAIKRDLLVEAVNQKTRGESLKLTRAGQHAIDTGLRALEQYAFKIFDAHNRNLNLMQHIDILFDNTKEVLDEKQYRDDESKRIRGDRIMQIPKARKLFRGDINAAVISVQKLTGIEITAAWWEKNVGNSGSAQEILDRFDSAYQRDYGAKIAAK